MVDKKKDRLQDELRLFIDYGVVDQIALAKALVDRYKASPLVIRLLHTHYSTLPEAREEAVCRVCRLKHRQGVHLFVAVAESFAYLYLVTEDEAIYLGEYGAPPIGDTAPQFLDFFGYSSGEDFIKKCPALEELDDFPVKGESEVCPVCQVAEGEYHLVGCVVEICPWCDAQLSGCNCRFEKLGLERIESEEELEGLVELLEEKGRIPFRKSQSPAYPGTSKGLDKK